jgi:uncharacterized protein
VNAAASSVSFLPAGKDKTPCLLGAKCGKCATVLFPKMPVCPVCLRNGAMSEIEIGRTGRLYSHTIARVAPKGFKAPFYQAFVDVPEGPRIFSLIGAEVPVEPDALQDGMAMRLVVEPLADTPENRGVLSYKYVPAGGKSRHA